MVGADSVRKKLGDAVPIKIGTVEGSISSVNGSFYKTVYIPEAYQGKVKVAYVIPTSSSAAAPVETHGGGSATIPLGTLTMSETEIKVLVSMYIYRNLYIWGSFDVYIII